MPTLQSGRTVCRVQEVRTENGRHAYLKGHFAGGVFYIRALVASWRAVGSLRAAALGGKDYFQDCQAASPSARAYSEHRSPVLGWIPDPLDLTLSTALDGLPRQNPQSDPHWTHSLGRSGWHGGGPGEGQGHIVLTHRRDSKKRESKGRATLVVNCGGHLWRANSGCGGHLRRSTLRRRRFFFDRLQATTQR